ncbi:MAG: diguanylate cyclase [Sulfurimonas sp.]|nr:MAG: diguanylate cyclase [Sulfurimonas sp.]
MSERFMFMRKNETALNLKNKETLINTSLLDEYKQVVDASAIVTKTDINGIITYANDGFCKITGYTRDELIGKPHNIVRDPNTPDEFYTELWSKILDKKVWKGIIRNMAKDKKLYYVKSTIVPILDFDGEIKEFIAIRNDVTELINQEKRIKSQITDNLTKLPNRQKLIEDLKKNEEYKLAIINIYEFKEINKYYGFSVGDMLIVKVAYILSKELEKLDVNLYSLAVGEFALLTNEIYSKEIFINLVKSLMKSIDSKNFYINEKTLNIYTYSGITMQKNYFQNVELAVNYAKEQKIDLVFLDDNPAIKKKMLDNIKWTNKLKEAIEDDRIKVFIQPIIDNLQGDIKKYECLVRLIDINAKVVSPSSFLQIAKKSRLYPQITKAVISKSFEYFKDKKDEFSINITLDDIKNRDTVDFLKDKLSEYKDIGSRLILEIVEDERIEEYKEVNYFIEEVRCFGCKIAIDDFGTGYSNFDYLMRLNIDFIKIDGSIIKNIDYDKNSVIITELIISFAKKLNIKTIGEFVHSESVYNKIKEMGVDYSQGYYFGEPKEISVSTHK